MKKKRLLFCNLRYDLPECNQAVYGKFFLVYGLGIIQDLATQHSIPFDYYDTYVYGSTDTFFTYYQKERHDVVLFSAICGNLSYKYLKYVFSRIKEINPSATIVLGGTITSIYPEILLEEVRPDIIVIGEGEITFLELANADFSVDDISAVEGIGYRKSNDYFLNPPRKPLLNPLEQQSCNPLFEDKCFEPFLSAYVKQQKEQNRGWEIAASRGCFGNCKFCKRVFDKPIRYFSASYVVETMARVKERHGLNRFNFLDENFVVNRKNFETFLDLLEEREMNVKWRIRARMDVMPYDLLDRMQKLGFYHVVIGIESANQDVLDYYNKRVVFEKYKENLKELAKRKLLFASFILGSPNESEKSLRDNTEFVRYSGLTSENTAVGYLSVIPGTEIFDDCLKNGIIKSERDYLNSYMGDFNKIEMNVSPLTDQQLMEGFNEMFRAAAANE